MQTFFKVAVVHILTLTSKVEQNLRKYKNANWSTFSSINFQASGVGESIFQI